MKRSLSVAAALLAAALMTGLAAGPSHGAEGADGGAPLSKEPAPSQVPVAPAPQPATALQLPPELAAVVKALSGINISFLGYVDYSVGDFANISGVKPQNLTASKTLAATNFSSEDAWKRQNRFELTRGYINISKQILPWLSARVTPDVTRVGSTTIKDNTGKSINGEAETGDIDFRVKYYYLQADTPDLGFLTNNAVKIGQQQFPYLDFLENINPYRMQGTMFPERFNEYNSADMGLGVQGLFGGKMPQEYQDKVSSQYPGRYGSYHLAVMNGGGYAASEANNNKALEYRLTARPLPDVVPGLQLTYFGIWGKGNTNAAPDWNVNTGLLSYQHEWGTLTAEFDRNKGEQDGNDAKWRTGYAVFGMIKPPMLPKWRASAQYGAWRYDTSVKNNDLTMWRAGIDYSLTKPKGIGGTFIYAGYERLTYGQYYNGVAGLNVPDEWRGQVVAQINW
jgi:hypothetical protein